MLKEISIRDFAIIDSLNLSLHGGLNVLTGETGAGKSIIIDAVGAVLGGRVSSDSIRSGSTRAVLEALFLTDDLTNPAEMDEHLLSLGLDRAGHELVLTREVLSSGKSVARINGRPVPVSTLREIGGRLVDIHGQHDHQSLLYPAPQLELLDRFAGLDPARREFTALFHRLREIEEECHSQETQARQRRERRQLLEFQVSEIDGARLTRGEDETLAQVKTRLLNAERLHKACRVAWTVLEGEEPKGHGAIKALALAVNELSAVSKLDPALEGLKNSLEDCFYSLREIASSLVRYQESIDFNPTSLEEVEERLYHIASLRKKYGATIDEILSFREAAASELESLTLDDRKGEWLTVEREKLREQCLAKAQEMSSRRRASARELSASVESELADLGMDKAQFEVTLRQAEMGPSGTDRAEFLISTNPGEPLKPLARIASGGEMARIMLAIKTVLARVDSVSTLIFDEVDAGIGGLTANAVAERLSRVADHRQVLCITHLPQIACRADNHFMVQKSVEGGRVYVAVEELDEEGRCLELARMLGGDPTDMAVLTHARSLLSLHRTKRDGDVPPTAVFRPR